MPAASLSVRSDRPTTILILHSENQKVKEKEMSDEKRKPYGEFGHVLLSDDDIKILTERFPGLYEDYIEKVDGYCESTGKSYKNYRATIQNWIRRDQSGKIKRAAAGVISHKPTYDINEISRRAVLNTEIKYKNQEVHNE